VKRMDIIEKLDQTFDVLIIGGGITGAGAARDAAHRGLKTALVEMQDIASGTSSRSSKLVHGGLRYLESAEFSLVFEAVSERRTLMNIAPHLVHPQGFLFPVYKSSRRGVFTVNLGMWLYDGLSLFRSPKIHKNLSRKEVAVEEPSLNQTDLKGAPLYYDCSTDDARLTLETTLDAVKHGAIVSTYTRVVGFMRDSSGRISGVRVRDEVSGEEREIQANAIINATGPWSDRTRLLGTSEDSARLRPTKGIHIVVDSKRLQTNHAVVCFHPRDGRVLFAIPWGERTYIGTTDTDYTDDPGEVCATGQDVRYLLEASNIYFPQAELTEDDVISTWAGVRPLIAEDGSDSASSVSREHDIRVGGDGLITIAGGKLTTYRRMGGEVVDTAVQMLRLTDKLPADLRTADTANEPLPGAVGWPENDDTSSIVENVLELSKNRITKETAEMLVAIYGVSGIDIARLVADSAPLGSLLVEGRPEIMAQVDFSVTRELALSLCDVMIRRTQLFFRDLDQGLGFCEQVAERMESLLGWDSSRTAAEILAYQKEVSRSRLWREE
jgi:glycerol-3-phosphate dehydrogenase